MAVDFFVVPTVTFRMLFVLVILAHERRRIVHVAVTEHPTAVWPAQQLRNAFPDDEAPAYSSRMSAVISQVNVSCSIQSRKKIALSFAGFTAGLNPLRQPRAPTCRRRL